MAEVSISSLDARLQKLVANVRVALERGNFDYAIEACDQILKVEPACLAVRKLQRAAQLKLFHGKNRLVAKALGGLSTAPFLFSASRKDPRRMLELAEKQLATNPLSVTALRQLADAALALDMPETAAFACEAVREIDPDDRENLLQLGEAYLAAKRPADALRAADAILRTRPVDGDAQNLMRRASVAQTMTRGNWESGGGFRDKLKDEAEAVSLEQSAKVVTSAEMTQRLIDEALARVRREGGEFASLGPDSGPVHIANALGTKVVGLYACTDPERSGPYSDRRFTTNHYDEAARRFLKKPAEALPWGKKVEFPGVMELIGVDEVADCIDRCVAALRQVER